MLILSISDWVLEMLKMSIRSCVWAWKLFVNVANVFVMIQSVRVQMFMTWTWLTEKFECRYNVPAKWNSNFLLLLLKNLLKKHFGTIFENCMPKACWCLILFSLNHHITRKCNTLFDFSQNRWFFHIFSSMLLKNLLKEIFSFIFVTHL